MDHDEYARMYDRIAAYRQAVIRRATAWVTENLTAFKVDNSFTDMDAFNVGLSEKITVEGGHFLVWLTHNTSGTAEHRVRVPAELLDVPELAA
ncbi:hypothetical protein [Arthrobacter sp. zg-Y1110]|uniref:hypothetical protein n=1 Tax=Arthrobacter sp. zg-Y1110 TaxID=2886932 RepID=UPI001D1471E8|nr:hypothetical protein [Arthrobacter sp. zg-Y1110]MCC3292886.1 hypothetical protein [Arthrobacter sp. zg-Y1110]UWX86824.1 hypothetical protein N2K99_18450 [Arthrobacter sp. zg-Y1110]